MTEQEKQLRVELVSIIGYTCETAAPNAEPTTEFITDRWMRPRLDRLVALIHKRDREHRKGKAAAWGAYLEVALDQRAEDGTPVLELVFAHNPHLAQRLKEVLDGQA